MPILVVCQPKICTNPPAMTSFCNQACIICDIDGFTGRNNSTVTGQAPPGFCTSQVHHMQWIGFIAGTTDLTLEVTVSNCVRNQGLEIGLYESLDCINFRQVSECDTDVRPGQTRVFRNTVPLVIGQYYYFVMDGSANDVCNWTIRVLEGTTKVAPLTIAPEIIVDDVVCQDYDFTLQTPGLVGATFYSWSIDGVPLKTGKEVIHKLNKPGEYKVCLDATNVCDQAPQSCKTIKVLETKKNTIIQEVCYGECFTLLGIKYCETGNYDIILTASNGCDSILTFDLSIKDKVTAYTKINICEGDTISIGDGVLFSQGNHEVKIKNQEGCDIAMTVEVTTIVCNIQGTYEATPVKCNGENTGTIRFRVDAGTPPFTYYGYKLENTSVNFAGNLYSNDQWVIINELDEGNYTINIEDSYGNTNVINQWVSQPSKLKMETRISSFNGYGVSCFEGNDGYIKWMPNGGVPDYKISHVFVEGNADSLGSLRPGYYQSNVQDANGCVTNSIIELTAPDALDMDVVYKNPDCTGPNTGEIVLQNTTGGVGPYVYRMNDKNISQGFVLSNLDAGIYTLDVQDKNGCTITLIDTLIAAIIPDVQVLNDKINVELGDSIILTALTQTESVNINWSPDEDLSCYNCLVTKTLPLNDQIYTVHITSKDGCTRSKTIDVRVSKKRSFVMSNVFTPNDDGINDRLSYLAGNDIANLAYLKIYDRWGNLIYTAQNIPASGITNLDWNGEFHGQLLQNGIYTWIANINYIDQVSIGYTGTITLLR